jgi:capsular polysaccharide biosynthesis protein
VRKDGGLACVDQLSLEQKKEQAAPIKSKTYSLVGITSGRTVHVETTILDEDKHTVMSSPNLTRRLIVVMLATLVVASILTILFRAPLEAAANRR